MPSFNTFSQDSARAGYIAVPQGSRVTVANAGNTLYYKSTSDVTSSSSDGSIATGASATFTSGKFVITAQGVTTSVSVYEEEGTDVAGTQPSSVFNIPAISTTQGTDTTNASGTEWVTSIFIPCNFTVTNIGHLNGSAAATDKIISVLYDSAGRVLANTTTASNGTTASGTAEIQTIALTTPYKAIGPARYYVGVRANGTNSKVRTIPAQLNSGVLAQENTVTHATVAAFTPAGTFTAAKGPYVILT